jgi:hypothetical protein
MEETYYGFMNEEVIEVGGFLLTYLVTSTALE